MPVERHFLDWNVPVTEKAVEFLLSSPISGPVDMGDQLIGEKNGDVLKY